MIWLMTIIQIFSSCNVLHVIEKGGGLTLAGEVAISNVHYQGLGHSFYGNTLSHATILLK